MRRSGRAFACVRKRSVRGRLAARRDFGTTRSGAPTRIEFFGDTVDSIREFDPETQLSTTQLVEVEIAPMRELVVRSRDFHHWAARARERWQQNRFARSLRDRTVFADESERF